MEALDTVEPTSGRYPRPTRGVKQGDETPPSCRLPERAVRLGECPQGAGVTSTSRVYVPSLPLLNPSMKT